MSSNHFLYFGTTHANKCSRNLSRSLQKNGIFIEFPIFLLYSNVALFRLAVWSLEYLWCASQRESRSRKYRWVDANKRGRDNLGPPTAGIFIICLCRLYYDQSSDWDSLLSKKCTWCLAVLFDCKGDRIHRYFFWFLALWFAWKNRRNPQHLGLQQAIKTVSRSFTPFSWKSIRCWENDRKSISPNALYCNAFLIGLAGWSARKSRRNFVPFPVSRSHPHSLVHYSSEELLREL